MAVRKAHKKSPQPRAAAKKTSSAKRPAAKSALKRTRRAVVAKGAVKTPRGGMNSRAAGSGRSVQTEPDRKPARKVEARPMRPPAVLPIPQSTFFF